MSKTAAAPPAEVEGGFVTEDDDTTRGEIEDVSAPEEGTEPVKITATRVKEVALKVRTAHKAQESALALLGRMVVGKEGMIPSRLRDVGHALQDGRFADADETAKEVLRELDL